MSYFKSKNEPLFLTPSIRKYVRDLERKFKTIKKQHESLKPVRDLQDLSKRKSKSREGSLIALLERIDHEKNPYKKVLLSNELSELNKEKSLLYQEAIISDLDDYLKNQNVAEFIDEVHLFLPNRDLLLKTYVSRRVDQEIKEFSSLNRGSLDIERSVFVKVRDVISGDLFSKESQTHSYLSDVYIKSSFKEGKTDYFPPEAFNDNVELFSSHNVIKLVSSSNIKNKTWFQDGKNYFSIIYSRSKSSKRELDKFKDTITGLRKEWYSDSIGTNEIVVQQRLYDLVNLIRCVHKENSRNGDEFSVDYRGIPSCYDAKAFNKILRDGKPFVNMIPNNEREYDLMKDYLLKGIFIDHSRGESICMTSEFFFFYTQTRIAHTQDFVNDRERRRVARLKSECLDVVDAYLDMKFGNMYELY